MSDIDISNSEENDKEDNDTLIAPPLPDETLLFEAKKIDGSGDQDENLSDIDEGSEPDDFTKRLNRTHQQNQTGHQIQNERLQQNSTMISLDLNKSLESGENTPGLEDFDESLEKIKNIVFLCQICKCMLLIYSSFM